MFLCLIKLSNSSFVLILHGNLGGSYVIGMSWRVSGLWGGFLISAGHGSGALVYPQLWHTITLLASCDVTRRRLVLGYRGFDDNLSALSSTVNQFEKRWNWEVANVTSQKSGYLIDTAAEAWSKAFLVVGSWVQKRKALPTNILLFCVHFKKVYNCWNCECLPKTVSWKEVWPWRQGEPSSDHAVPTAATYSSPDSPNRRGGDQRCSQHTM
jgi:hypothetical protein